MQNDNITFDEVKYKPRDVSGTQNNASLVQFLINSRIAKNEKQANVILSGVAIAALIATVYVFAVFVFDIDPRKSREHAKYLEQVKADRQKIQDLKNGKINSNNPSN